MEKMSNLSSTVTIGELLPAKGIEEKRRELISWYASEVFSDYPDPIDMARQWVGIREMSFGTQVYNVIFADRLRDAEILKQSAAAICEIPWVWGGDTVDGYLEIMKIASSLNAYGYSVVETVHN